jgi:ribosome-binding factor A
MAQGHRPDRVGDQIRETLSEMLTRGAVHDPGIGFITLTRVKVSADLQMARVFYTTLGDEKARSETARALERATPFFRRQVGSQLRLRRVPELEFRFDESIAHQDRIEQILRDLHAEEARLAAAAADDVPAPAPSEPPSSADRNRADEPTTPAHTTNDHRD